MIYAPLENPWFSMTTIAILGGIIAIFCCCFKGEISCCARKLEFNPRKQEEKRKNLDKKVKKVKDECVNKNLKKQLPQKEQQQETNEYKNTGNSKMIDQNIKKIKEDIKMITTLPKEEEVKVIIENDTVRNHNKKKMKNKRCGKYLLNPS